MSGLPVPLDLGGHEAPTTNHPDDRYFMRDRAPWPEVFADFDYRRPGYRLELRDDGFEYALYVHIETVDTYSDRGDEVEITHRRPLPNRIFDEDRAVQYLRRELHLVDNHETDEWILYKGEMIFDPHKGDLP